MRDFDPTIQAVPDFRVNGTVDWLGSLTRYEPTLDKWMVRSGSFGELKVELYLCARDRLDQGLDSRKESCVHMAIGISILQLLFICVG